MTFPFICIFVAWLFIWLPRVVVAVGQARAPEGFDNHHPRDQQAKLQGWARRANAAHANAFESFAPFAAAVMVAHLAHAQPEHTTWLAGTFVVARMAYPFLYIADIAAARSGAWMVGTLATAGLFVAAFFGVR